MQKIMLNPTAIMYGKDTSQVNILLNRKLFRLSGPLTNKYFSNYLHYFLEPVYPLDIFNRIKEIDTRREFDFQEFSKLVIELLDKNILVRLAEKMITHYKDINVLFVDYTVQNTYKDIEDLIPKLIDESNKYINISITLISSSNFDKTLLEEYDLIIPIFWKWSTLFEKNIIDMVNNETYILPIISNDDYFSIGPSINGHEGLKDALQSLNIERSRYAYFHHQDTKKSLSLLATFLLTEIIEMVKIFSGYNESLSRTIGQMITYKYSTLNLEIKRYRAIALK